MVGFERICGHHADLLRTILARMSDPNKLPVVHDQEVFWAMDRRAFVAHATVPLRQRLLNMHGQLVVAARCHRYGGYVNLREVLP
jgi:hypothetical protein